MTVFVKSASLQSCAGCLDLLIVPLLFSGTLNQSEICLSHLKIYPGDCLPYLFKLTFWVNYNGAFFFSQDLMFNLIFD